MRIFFKSFFPVLLALLCNVLVEVHEAKAQQSPDSTQSQIVPDSSLNEIKFYSNSFSSRVSSLPRTKKGKLYGPTLGFDRTTVTWDTLSTFRISRTIYNRNVYYPSVMNFEEFSSLKKEEQKNSIRAQLIQESKNQEEVGRGLLDFKINVPGGENSAFTTIFGTNEVNLRVNGSANMNIGASIQKLDDGTLPPDLRTRVDPTFNQNLQLNIQGTIGDKLTIATDWDTERQFDFENRLSIVYEGYEDEIIKSIQMGNVSMETGNSLVSGGKSLFGIKAISELGPLKVTSVISQQKGKNNSQRISGGSQETSIDLSPADYEDGRHFFLDFFNRDFFELALEDPQNILQPYQVSELYVYVRIASSNTPGEKTQPAIALLDLGVNENGGFPGNEEDRFEQELLESLRPTESTATNEDFGASSQEYVDSIFELLEEGVDYTFNRALGFISMRSYINSADAIAVSYVYTNPQTGENIQVGDLNTTDGNRLYLKLLRPGGMTTQDRAWPLTMRNIYSLGVSGITPEGFELEIADTRGNIPLINLPQRSESLLEDLGLDRLNSEGAVSPDNIVDFTGITLDAGSGRLMFPYLEPFGDRVIEVLEGVVEDSVRNELAFTELYDLKQTDARVNSKNSNYTISGKSSGGVSGSFTLGFGLVEGSVKVFANNVELTEGSDYEVDYSFGSLTILNDKFLASGQEIEVEYENNQFSIIGQKNFTGIRAEYTVNNDIKIGSTFFKLNEQPLSDKIRIGNEPINNTVLGLDAKAKFNTPWLTRFIDKIPLLQTKTPSDFTFSGEFAQLRPGVAQTNAVQEAIDNGDLFSDEENGLVFIDDFEGAEYSISFTNPTRWNLAAAPGAVPGYSLDETYFSDPDQTQTSQTIDDRKARADLRSQFSWYSIPRNIGSIRNAVATAESETILLEDVFQGRETVNRQDEVITSLDVHYNPNNRGPYNYNNDLKNILENEPDRTWGGMTAVIPPGQEDLVQNNIEFLEFWVQAILPGDPDPTEIPEDYDGKIYLDLGIISEDVVPNVRLNTEDGLSTVLNNLTEDDPEGSPRSYIPPSPPVPLGQFSNSNRALEDVGLDGAPNPGTEGANGKDEGALFADFIESIRTSYGEGSEMFQSVEADPSNDDYVYYAQNSIVDLPLHERFHRMLGYHDGNTPESGAADNKTAITLRPDTEGLVSSSSIQQSNSYYQYEIDFNPADRDNLNIDVDGDQGTYIIDKIEGSIPFRTWYLVRVPLTDFKRKFGEVENFQNISYMRMWMSGYKKPFTLRFATYEFVGSQWRKVSEISEAPDNQDNFKVSTINIEENANREPFPYRQPDGSIRALNRSAQVQALENEQSLVLNVENLGPGEIQMVKRVYPGKLNLLNYSNVRMFVHGEGFEKRGDAELVVRFGSDLENNFYEYRQPVTPSEPMLFDYDPSDGGRLEAEAQEIWRYDENSMNIVISAFNVLKQRRDAAQADPTEIYELQGLLGDDGVSGAWIGIRGNPSLDRVSEIGLGIKNPNSATNNVGTSSLDAEMWLNELRVSGFDNEFGWAANAKSSVKFADFATLNANLSRRTNGFGGLDSRLGERSVSDQIGYGLSTTVNLHKLVPDRYGWNFPVNISTRRNVQTPKYLPDQGDIRLSDFEDAINGNDDFTNEEKQDLISDKISDIETVSENFSFNMSNISKSNSKSKLAKLTIDNLKLSYVYNKGYAKNPQLIFQDRWDYKASVQYSLRFQKVKLVRPFAFTENVPVLKAISGLRLGYLPSSISTSTSFTRRYDESRRRNLADPTTQQSLNQQHAFNQQNNFSLNYSLTQSIPITYSNSTSFDLSSAGIEQRNISGVDSSSFDVKPTFEVLSGLVSDTLRARRSSYSERFTASWRPDLTKVGKGINWLTYSASYGGGYQWNNAPRGSNLGASVANNFQLDNTLRLNTDRIFNKLGFFTKIKDSDSDETKERKSKGEARKKEAEDTPDSLRTPRPNPEIFKDLRFIGRKFFLAVFSMKDISGSYKRTKSGSQPGYTGGSQIYYAFNSAGSNNFSPPIGYRIGLQERIPLEQLIANLDGDNEVRLPANNRYSDGFSVGTRITPIQNITIDLDWTASITSTRTENITVSTSGQYSSITTESGNYNTSVWAFGKGYEDFFRKQLETAYGDIVDGSTTLEDSEGNNDGKSVLNRNTLQDDFRKAYLGEGSNGIGDKGFLAFPKPDWRVNWSRFEKYIPFLGKYMTTATLVHAYRGSYRLDWSLNAVTGLQPGKSLGDYTVIDERGLYEPNSIRVEQRFSPLAKLNVTWKSNLRTELGYDRGNISSFAINSNRVTETLTRGVDFSVNYTFRNVKISFLPKVKNNIDMSIRGSFKNDTENSYKLDTDLNNALNDSNNLPSVNEAAIDSKRETGQKRLNGSFTLGYQISRTISSNFEYTFSRIESNTIPTRTNHDIRFNVRIAIRSR